MNKDKTNKKMNINEILALVVTYLEKQIEYTELKLEHHKQWQADDEEDECENQQCLDDDCEGECEVEVSEEAIISFSDEQQHSFDESFKEEWS